VSNEKIEQLLVEFRDAGDNYSTAKAHLVYLEDFKKSKIAILMKTAQKLGIQTASGQEREAYAHEEYMELLEAIKTATESESKLKFLLRKIEMEIEVWRTTQANERMERRAYGG
jgi:hypothetical protein